MTDRIDLLALVLPLERRLRRIEDDAALAEGLSMWQYAILAAAERHPGQTQAWMVKRLDYDKNRIVADVDHLGTTGLLERRPGADRRSHALHTTAAGRRVRRRVQRAIHRGEDLLLQDVPPSVRTQLDHALAATVVHLRSSEDRV